MTDIQNDDFDQSLLNYNTDHAMNEPFERAVTLGVIRERGRYNAL